MFCQLIDNRCDNPLRVNVCHFSLSMNISKKWGFNYADWCISSKTKLINFCDILLMLQIKLKNLLNSTLWCDTNPPIYLYYLLFPQGFKEKIAMHLGLDIFNAYLQVNIHNIICTFDLEFLPYQWATNSLKHNRGETNK